MNLADKSQAVLNLFGDLEEESKLFTSKSGLGCLTGCGACCSKPEVSASALEFLPLAFDLYKKGLAESSLELLDKEGEGASCLMYKSHSLDGKMGFCGNYSNRGMICRLFGASYRKNKYGQKDIITCKILKENKEEAFLKASISINDELPIPNATKYYMHLEEIDEALCRQVPINLAIGRALELVLRFKFYEEEEIEVLT